MDKKVDQIKASALISYITIFFSIVTGFLYTPWLIKQLGSSDYALYSLVISVMTYFVIDFGIGATVTRFVAKYRIEGKEEKANNLLGITCKLYLILDIIVFVSLLVVYYFIENIYVNLTHNEIERFKVIFAITGIMSLFSIPFLPQNGIYIAFERFSAVKLFDLLNKGLTVGMIVVFLILGKGLYAVVVVNAVVAILINFIKLYYIKKKENIKINIKYRDTEMLKEIFSFSAWVAVAMVADRLFFAIIPTLLGMVSNSMQISIFAIGASIEGYVFIFANALNGLFLPRVTKMVVEKQDREEITDLMIKVGRIQLIIISFFIIGMISLGQEFVHFWVGDTYKSSYIVIVLLLIPCLVHLTQGIASELIFATNNVKYRALIYVVGSIISVITTLLLAPQLGAIGAALGIFLGFTVAHEIMMNIIYQKKMGLNIPRFFKECHFSMLIPMLLGIIIGFLMQTFIPTNSLVQFLIKGIVWAAIYGALLWIISFNNSEKEMVLGMVKKFINIRSRH